ncbi:cytochrome P450 [Saccharopolyspora rhizosphaerae]|uniref:Cytochrome P450 n=1 Tax=Saccharopolyspora rhizosphaerae TaxID=2492662 RepID=A0A3R8NV28_9PSEU|nr:cytochrome P450 [Saccharopolyspora rhizosphaerae]RRO13727.1 cytochrome P450 [Saccharopolyspora rhizosphaerae]
MTDDRTRLHGPDFAADPQTAYRRMRAAGPTAPVEIAPDVPATLVLGYAEALQVLRDPANFPKDPRTWERTVPQDCTVLPLMGHQPNCNGTDGAAHTRLRGAMTDALARVDTRELRTNLEETADALIDRFAADGKADLVEQYAQVLPLLMVTRICGSPPVTTEKIVSGALALFTGTDDGRSLRTTVVELVAAKRAKPGPDVVSWLLAHQAGLTDDEAVHQVALLCAAGSEPLQNLIANTLRLLLVDERFAGDLSGGSLPVADALDEVLWTDPPIANHGTVFPPREAQVGGTPVPADQPLLISFAGANTDPAVAAEGRVGNRAHIAFGAGRHACPTPAQRIARMTGTAAVERVLDRLPDLEPAVPADALEWKSSPFHRALASLPVTFPPPPQQIRPWLGPPPPVIRRDPGPHKPTGAWSSFVRWLRGG